MGKVGILIWIMLAPTVMGLFVLALLLTPSLADQQMTLILPVAAAGAVVAAPLSFLIAKKLSALGKK
ncbi:MAG: hypothetical protein H6868_01990 [Rhodospirillales bacterium]|nr:hypothetical protein [Rhodospirillales bacterium]